MPLSLSSSTSSMKAKSSRPSYINLSNIPNDYINSNNHSSSIKNDILSPRTPHFITKPKRSSFVTEQVVQDILLHQAESPALPRRKSVSMHTVEPCFMSDTTASYFCHDSQQKNEIVPPERSTTVKTNDNLKIHDLSITEDDQESSSSSSSINHIVSPITTTAFIKGRCTTQSFSSTTALISPHVLLPSFDVHTLYKLKTTRSSKKLDDFFGEYAPHDICIKEIQKEGLKAILQSKTPLCYFLYHLLQEYCSENLFFFIELEQYESFTYTSTSQQMTSAQHIFNTYLTKNSYFEVNLDEKDRRKIIQALGEKDVKNCFDSAKRAVYSLLESSYMQFQNTDIFQEMIQNCGELTTYYDDKAKAAAVNKLLNYIESQYDKIYLNLNNNNTPTSTTTLQHLTKKRYELLKSMIHEFCRTLVKVEFHYYVSNKTIMNGSKSTHDHGKGSSSSSLHQRTKLRRIVFPPFNNNKKCK